MEVVVGMVLIVVWFMYDCDVKCVFGNVFVVWFLWVKLDSNMLLGVLEDECFGFCVFCNCWEVEVLELLL